MKWQFCLYLYLYYVKFTKTQKKVSMMNLTISKHTNINENEYEISTLKWLQAEYEQNIYIYYVSFTIPIHFQCIMYIFRMHTILAIKSALAKPFYSNNFQL